ncbi:uracil-xanthine permease family protein [Persicobacter psychrovividus]|uniref:Uracil permease n=1 Tax=Persicobacter psychrovividus TaxID=387638 RepID=A0ABM7VCB1_9BACT|nr:uracil permease [Persicobacter psychrovividus]
MKQSSGQQVVLGVQFLFVAFGATVLVPLLVGIDPAVALFTAGVGTLIFHLITKGKVPVFLGSSFAFIAPIIACTKLYGLESTFSGLIAVGGVYAVASGLIKLRGLKDVERLFPPAVVGPVIMVIGLSLAHVAVDMAKTNWFVAIVVLLTAMVINIYGKGFMKLVPIFGALVIGYCLSVALDLSGLYVHFGDKIIDFSPIINADWFALPKFIHPEFNWNAVLFMLPVAFAPMIEHIGDMYAISTVAKKDFVKEPGLHRTLLGDGIATAFAGFLGGPPNTTYSEVTGAISLTGVTNPTILRISAITAICFSVIGKVSGFLRTIPQAVLGGIMLLLFGTIASVGIGALVQNKDHFAQPRNQAIAAVILTIGIGGAVFQFGEFSLSGIGLASLVGVVLNLILPDKSHAKK